MAARQPQRGRGPQTEIPRVAGERILFLIFSVFKASLLVRGSMLAKIFSASPLWFSDGCAKNTDHCCRHPRVYQRDRASVSIEKQLNMTERTIWARHGTLLGWSDPTF